MEVPDSVTSVEEDDDVIIISDDQPGTVVFPSNRRSLQRKALRQTVSPYIVTSTVRGGIPSTSAKAISLLPTRADQAPSFQLSTSQWQPVAFLLPKQGIPAAQGASTVSPVILPANHLIPVTSSHLTTSGPVVRFNKHPLRKHVTVQGRAIQPLQVNKGGASNQKPLHFFPIKLVEKPLSAGTVESMPKTLLPPAVSLSSTGYKHANSESVVLVLPTNTESKPVESNTLGQTGSLLNSLLHKKPARIDILKDRQKFSVKEVKCTSYAPATTETVTSIRNPSQYNTEGNPKLTPVSKVGKMFSKNNYVTINSKGTMQSAIFLPATGISSLPHDAHQSITTQHVLHNMAKSQTTQKDIQKEFVLDNSFRGLESSMALATLSHAVKLKDSKVSMTSPSSIQQVTSAAQSVMLTSQGNIYQVSIPSVSSASAFIPILPQPISKLATKSPVEPTRSSTNGRLAKDAFKHASQSVNPSAPNQTIYLQAPVKNYAVNLDKTPKVQKGQKHIIILPNNSAKTPSLGAFDHSLLKQPSTTSLSKQPSTTPLPKSILNNSVSENNNSWSQGKASGSLLKNIAVIEQGEGENVYFTTLRTDNGQIAVQILNPLLKKDVTETASSHVNSTTKMQHSANIRNLNANNSKIMSQEKMISPPNSNKLDKSSARFQKSAKLEKIVENILRSHKNEECSGTKEMEDTTVVNVNSTSECKSCKDGVGFDKMSQVESETVNNPPTVAHQNVKVEDEEGQGGIKLKITSVFSLNPECEEYSEPDEKDEITFTQEEYQSWSKLMAPCFVVLERLSDYESSLTHITNSKCSNHCRQRTLKYLCNLKLLKCEKSYDLINSFGAVKNQPPIGLGTSLPAKVKVHPLNEESKEDTNAFFIGELEKSVNVYPDSKVCVLESLDPKQQQMEHKVDDLQNDINSNTKICNHKQIVSKETDFKSFVTKATDFNQLVSEDVSKLVLKKLDDSQVVKKQIDKKLRPTDTHAFKLATKKNIKEFVTKEPDSVKIFINEDFNKLVSRGTDVDGIVTTEKLVTNVKQFKSIQNNQDANEQQSSSLLAAETVHNLDDPLNVFYNPPSLLNSKLSQNIKNKMVADNCSPEVNAIQKISGPKEFQKLLLELKKQVERRRKDMEMIHMSKAKKSIAIVVNWRKRKNKGNHHSPTKKRSELSSMKQPLTSMQSSGNQNKELHTKATDQQVTINPEQTNSEKTKVIKKTSQTSKPLSGTSGTQPSSGEHSARNLPASLPPVDKIKNALSSLTKYLLATGTKVSTENTKYFLLKVDDQHVLVNIPSDFPQNTNVTSSLLASKLIPIQPKPAAGLRHPAVTSILSRPATTTPTTILPQSQRSATLMARVHQNRSNGPMDQSARTQVQPLHASNVATRSFIQSTQVNSNVKIDLSHLPLDSSLLPQKKKQPFSLSEEDRRVKRIKLETKYPLPPGVIIKSEPDEIVTDNPISNNWTATSELLVTGPNSTVTQCSDRSNDNTSHQTADESDEPPSLVSVQSSLSCQTVTQDNEDEAPPLLQPIIPEPTCLESEANDQAIEETSVDLPSVSSTVSQISISSCESGYISDSTKSTTKPISAYPKQVHKNSKIERLKELLKKKELEIEEMKRKNLLTFNHAK